MSQTKEKRHRIRPAVLIPFFAGGIVGAVFARLVSADKRSITDILFMIVGMLAAFFIQIIIHEGGHLIFGLLSGYSFSSFRIMSFMWIKEDGRLRMKRLSLAGTGGQCLMAPPELKEGRMPVFWYNLGGVIMNLLTAGLFLSLYFIPGRVPFFSDFCLAMAFVGILYAVMNGIPIHTTLIDNDGYNAYSLSKNKKAMKAMWVQLKVNELNSVGVRLKDMPEELFEVPKIEDMTNSVVAAVGVFAANRLMDEHRFDEAEALMKQILNADTAVAGIYRSMMTCDRVYIELTGENRKERVEELYTQELTQFMQQMNRFPTIVRTQYVYELLGRKDPDKAAEYKKLFEQISESYPYKTDIQSERELMELAEQKVL